MYIWQKMQGWMGGYLIEKVDVNLFKRPTKVFPVTRSNIIFLIVGLIYKILINKTITWLWAQWKHFDSFYSSINEENIKELIKNQLILN